MKLTLRGNRYVLIPKRSDKHIPRQAGFKYDRSGAKNWYTTDWKIAAEFVEHADELAAPSLKEHIEKYQKKLEASYSMFADLPIPVPEMFDPVSGEKLDYLPYQKAGIQYASKRKYTLIADAPGLGKTIQAIGIINYHDIQSGLIICPSGLKYNWEKELKKWLVDKTLTVGVAEGNNIPDTDFVIINYDIVNRHFDKLRQERWGVIIPDESQVLSNPKAKRTIAVLGQRFAKKWSKKPLQAWKWVFLSGTPITKQPIQLWPIIQLCDPEGLGKSWDDFVIRYCDAFEGMFGMDTSGGSNLKELNEKLRLAFMVRRLKKHVLKHLPPKNREVVLLPPEGLHKLIDTERDKFELALAKLEALNDEVEFDPDDELDPLDPAYVLDNMATVLRDNFDAISDELDGGDLIPEFTAYSEARRELALAKLPMCIEHIKRVVDSGHKVVVFAIHKEVINRLREAFPNSARIVGGMTAKKVEKEKVRFQGDRDAGILPDPDCLEIFANIKAGGTGHTLTEATYVIFVECWSVPGEMEQCEDRAHRIGQTEQVTIQYLVVNGTMDANTMESLIFRIEMIENAIDG